MEDLFRGDVGEELPEEALGPLENLVETFHRRLRLHPEIDLI